jgi:hypothetical protein
VLTGYDSRHWQALGTQGPGWGSRGALDVAFNSTDIAAIYSIAPGGGQFRA